MGRTPARPRLWKRENGKWYLIWWDHVADARRYKSCDEYGAIDADGRKRMLEDYKRNELRSAVTAMDAPVGTNYGRKLGEAVRAYLADATEREVSGELRASSLRRLHLSLDRFIGWLPETLTTGALNPRHLEQFLRQACGDMKPATLNTEKQNLRSCLRWLASERPKLFPEPELLWPALKGRRVQKTALLAYTKKELATFREHCDGMQERVFLLTALTGARASEVRALTWADVDKKSGRVIVRATKTGRTRYVPLKEIAPSLLSAMADWEAVCPVVSNADFWWKVVSGKAGITITPQRLRRNFTSWALACGHPPAVVAQWQGHSLQVAQDWYAQQVVGHVRAASIQAAMGL